jgi:hypothetical protein
MHLTPQEAFYKIIQTEIYRHLEDSEISKLCHFYAAERLERIHRYYLGLPTTIAALLLSWLVAQKDLAFPFETAAKISLSLVVTIITGINTFLNLNELASSHRKAALRYQDIWRKCKNWQTDFYEDSNLEQAKSSAQSYRAELTAINQQSPQIPKWAYKNAFKQRISGSTTYDIRINSEDF